MQIPPNVGMTDNLKNNLILALVGASKDLNATHDVKKIEFSGEVLFVKNVWDVFQKNGDALKSDFELLTKNKRSQPLSNSVTVIGDKNLVFLEEGAKAEACILNTTTITDSPPKIEGSPSTPPVRHHP